MIVVKTKMRSIPKMCVQCSYYLRSSHTFHGRPACVAVAAFKESSWKALDGVQTTKERAQWCPLMEVIGPYRPSDAEQFFVGGLWKIV